MAGVRKTSGTGATRGVVYDLTATRQRGTPPPAFDRADSAGITPQARDLAHALAAVEGASEVRAERVRRLREQIRNGTYNPDPAEIARRLVERGF